MSSRIILLVFCMSLGYVVQGQVIDFPDPNFKNALLDHSPVIDTNGDNEIQVSEANAFVSPIDVENKDISDLTGIEFFVNIPELNCSWNDLTSLDVSNNLSLIRLEFSLNDLTELDVSSNVLLEHLDANSNDLTSLNLGEASALTSLDLRYNELTDLDLSNKESLQMLEVNYNVLASLTISGTPLTLLDLRGNNLSNLDLSNQFQLVELDLAGNDFESIDLSGATNLEVLWISGNDLITLDISELSSLQYLSAIGNELTSVNFGVHEQQISIGLYDNSLTEIDVSGLPNLYMLDVGNNLLNELDLSNNLALYDLDIAINQLTEIDLTSNSNLERLDCSFNELVELDISATRVVRLKCHSNTELTSVNLRNDRNWQFILQDWNFSNLPLLSEVCLDQDWETNPIMMEWINSEVGHEVTFFNNESCDEFVLSLDDQNVTSVQLLPNPAREDVRISGIERFYYVKVFDLTGQLVLDQRSDGLINVESLKAGIYFVELTGEDGYRTISRLIKQ